jgi:hypothetical protein
MRAQLHMLDPHTKRGRHAQTDFHTLEMTQHARDASVTHHCCLPRITLPVTHLLAMSCAVILRVHTQPARKGHPKSDTCVVWFPSKGSALAAVQADRRTQEVCSLRNKDGDEYTTAELLALAHDVRVYGSLEPSELPPDPVAQPEADPAAGAHRVAELLGSTHRATVTTVTADSVLCAAPPSVPAPLPLHGTVGRMEEGRYVRTKATLSLRVGDQVWVAVIRNRLENPADAPLALGAEWIDQATGRWVPPNPDPRTRRLPVGCDQSDFLCIQYVAACPELLAQQASCLCATSTERISFSYVPPMSPCRSCAAPFAHTCRTQICTCTRNPHFGAPVLMTLCNHSCPVGPQKTRTSCGPTPAVLRLPVQDKSTQAHDTLDGACAGGAWLAGFTSGPTAPHQSQRYRWNPAGFRPSRAAADWRTIMACLLAR